MDISKYSSGEFVLLMIFAIIIGIGLMVFLFKLVYGLLPYLFWIGVIWGLYHWFPNAMGSILMILGVPFAIYSIIVGLPTRKQSPPI